MKIKSVFLPKDTDGNVVHAHGGQITKDGEYYYLIGENRVEKSKVACYRTKDFKEWEFRGILLSLDSKVEQHPYVRTHLELDIPEEKANIGNGCNIERPKVIYNKLIKKYVMWMHWERPHDYKEARCAVAVCDTIDGKYTYLGSFNPEGYMSRDCTLFVDDDDSAYFISSSRENQDLHIYKLSEDYLSIDRMVRVLWSNQAREAPTVFKKDGLYYILSSACTGWNPNQSSYAYADKIDGNYTLRKGFGDDTTYRSQPTWVLNIDEEYYYIGDRWGGDKGYFTSEYMVLPIDFDGKEISISYKDEIDISI